MADGMVSIEVSTKLAETLRSFDALAAGVGKVVERLDQVSQQSRRTRGDVESLGSKALNTAKEMLGIGSAAQTVSSMWRLAIGEIRGELDRLKNAAKFQIDSADARMGAILNLGLDPSMTPAQLDKRITDISTRFGSDPTKVASEMASALGARGQFSPGIAADTLDTVAWLNKNLPQGLAAQALDYRNTFGGGTKASVGMVLAGMQTSRVDDISQYANSVQAMKALSNYGLNARESIALTSSLTLSTGDKTGAFSGTAATGIVAQAYEAVKGTPQEKLGWTELDAYLRSPQGKKARDKMLKDLHGEAKTLPVMKGYWNTGSREQKQYLDTLALVPRDDKAAEEYLTGLKNNMAVEGTRAAGVSSGYDALANELQSDAGEAEKAVKITGIRNILEKSRLPLKTINLTSYDVETLGLGRDPKEVAVRMANLIADQQETRAGREEWLGFDGSDNRELAKYMRELAQKIEKLDESMKANTDATRNNTSASGGGSGAADRPPPRNGEPGGR